MSVFKLYIHYVSFKRKVAKSSSRVQCIHLLKKPLQTTKWQDVKRMGSVFLKGEQIGLKSAGGTVP